MRIRCVPGHADKAIIYSECGIQSSDKVDYVQVMLEGKEDEMDVGECSESYQDNGVDVSEYVLLW